MVYKAVGASIILLFLASAPADACDCSGKPLSSAIRTDYPFVFEGKVVEIVERSFHTARTTSGGGTGEVEPLGRDVVFEVTRAWNGVTTKRIAVSATWSDCMFPFEVDHTYVVFSWKGARGELMSSHCSPTVESGKAANVLAYLGPATVPKR